MTKQEINKRYRQNNPWISHYEGAKERCESKKHKKYKWYGGKGVRFLLTTIEIKTLWLRDKAYSMKRPSIDRIDSCGNYEMSNCRFIELKQNILRTKRIWTDEQKMKLSIKMRRKYELSKM